MTESEKIKIQVFAYKKLKNNNQAFFVDNHEDVERIINALEKQIPKKIVYRNQTYGTPWLCPICEADQIKVEFFNDDVSQTKEKYSFCWKCGQAIDWSN